MKPRGFALVSALFLIVVLSILGGFLVDIVAVQHATPAMRIRAARADYAARAGLAWAIRKATVPGSSCPADTSFTLSEAAVAGYAVRVRCTRQDHELDGATVPYYVVEASAQSGTYGSQDFVSRSLRAKVSAL